MYFIFKELYAKDETEPICRYTVDIYNMPVPDSHYIKIIKGPMVRSTDSAWAMNVTIE